MLSCLALKIVVCKIKNLARVLGRPSDFGDTYINHKKKHIPVVTHILRVLLGREKKISRPSPM